MRDRYLIVAATIVASAITACSDAAVDQVTAPPIAATPVQPVADQWPTEEEYISNEISSAIGLQITVNPYFEPDSLWFVVEAHVQFQWANDVSATLWAWLINKNGTTINSGEAGISYRRLALPVPSGDTTFVVRISTNNIKCGLIGKSAYAGAASAKAIDSRIVVINLWEQNLLRTNGPDVLQPACPEDDGCGVATRVISATSAATPYTSETCEEEAPPAPTGGDEPIEVCYDVWTELWIYDYRTRTLYLYGEWYVGRFCYLTTEY